MVTSCALNLDKTDPKWTEFQKAFQSRYGTQPDAYAAYAYDGMKLLIASIERAGLNRGEIMDALRAYRNKTYEGVTGQAQFDPTLNNIAPISLARVENGRFVYWSAARKDSTGAKSGGGEQ